MRRLKRAVVPSLLVVAIYYAVFGGTYSEFDLREARAAVTAEETKLAAVEQRIDSLTTWVESLENDDATIERVARERFGMIREGETLYRFVPDAGETGRRGPQR